MFTLADVIANFPTFSHQVIYNALSRLKHEKRLFSPFRSFYITLAPQYVARGSVPPFYYMDELMKYLGHTHYFGLLSAASIWGAAHQRAQTDFVFLNLPRLTASITEQRRIKWIYRKEICPEFLCERNSEAGVIRYSNAELTALDLVQYEQHAGGLSHVCTVLSELLEETDFAHASEGVFKYVKDTTIQRFGYLVEHVLGNELQSEVIYHEWIRTCPHPHYLPLSVRSDIEGAPRDERWRIVINADVEVDEI